MADGLRDEQVAQILREARTFAVVGASNKEERPSYGVMAFLLSRGYTVHPVNPGLAGREIMGRKVYPALSSIPAPVDVVDIFRTADAVAAVVQEALMEKQRLGIKVIWMQLGIVNQNAANEAAAEGLSVIMDRCPKIEAARLFL